MTIFTSKVFFTSNNEAETIIQQYIEYLNFKKWDEYVELFNYDNEGKEDLLSFLKDSKNQSKKEGIHGIQEIKLVSMKLSNDPEFSSKGDFVYDVLLDMNVHKQSEFYTDGITRHIFILNKTNEGLKIETVYYKGLVDETNEENEKSTLNYIPIEPVPRPIPVNIKLYDTSKSQLKTLTLRTYAWYNIENPRKPATDYNAHVTDKWANYQHYKEGSNHATTNSLVDQLHTYAMLRSQGPFDAQYRAGSQVSTGTNGGNILSQWGTVQLANQGYTYTQILKYYYTNTFVANYYPVPHLIQ